MRRFLRALISLCAVSALVCGCSDLLNQFEPKRIEEIRAVPPVVKVTNFTIQRSALKSALAQTKENSIRLVPVFQSTAPGRSYEHRLFDVKAKSVWVLLGLQSADVLVAADGYLVKRAEQFFMFSRLLEGQDQATIEIRRNGEARLLKYTFVPSVGSAPSSDIAQ